MMNGPIRVLIVDDDYRVAGIHAAFVGRVDGFVAIGAANSAATALDLVNRLRPDVILLDVYLPDRDGLSLMRALAERSDPPDFIAITAARDVSTVRTAMQLGAVHYLVKPFRFADLRDRLLSYADLRRRIATLEIGDARQEDVDELFGMLRRRTVPKIPVPAKGHSAPTLELVRNAVAAAPGEVSAVDVAAAVGISRATAQRYLRYLADHGLLRLQLRYGATGRPEHRYFPAT
ncbi:response regulator [Frankia sp. AgB1.8]|nr:response regulator [Frankia sp. AgB1.8]